ncbi:MAG: penicillin-binding protein 2 [Candidatus Eisenbacteria bacterium]|nr:penicillin-binding protein 2 [Candidatus Eisenbacteria bacterium]
MIERMDPGSRIKSAALGLILGLGFAVLLGRLFQMQVIGTEEYRTRAEENRIRPERITALRGSIFDRSGAVLADNRPSFSVSVIPYQVRRDRRVLEELSRLTGAPQALLQERLQEGFARPYEPWPVLRDVDIAVVSRVEEHRHLLSGVLIESEPVRRYPHGELAAHVLGYLGEVSAEELQGGRRSVYGAGGRIGRNGVERIFDDRLRGRDGVRYVQEDAHGRPLGVVRENEPTPGEDLLLSLDADLQARAESLLSAGGSGAIVALDPRSGDVLVLASRPGYDPNLFAVAIPPEVWDSLSGDPSHPLLNRAIQSTYPPGSTFKPITAMEGLLEGIVEPETRLLPCFGSYRFGRRVFHCWREEGHGSLPLRLAIERSCDVYFYQIGAEMDLDHFSEIAARYGFGRRTGIALPGEREGLLPTTDYMNKRYGRSGWGPGFLLNHSIGQGEILVTPLQIACFYASLGTGRSVSPRLLLQSEDVNGVATAFPPEPGESIDIAERVLRPVLDGIALAVEGEHSTGGAARVPGMRVSGKTGTAENPHGEDHAWFAAWAPSDAPRIVVAVIVENAGHGGDVAAPLVGELLRYFFSREGV